MNTDTRDETLESLLLYLLEWLEADERSYEEVMEAWRTTCPRSLFGKKRTIADWLRARS